MRLVCQKGDIGVLKSPIVGECIDGSKYSKIMYVEALTSVMSIPISNGDNSVNVEYQKDEAK